MIGSRLLHYEIQERLGQGSVGTVYKARDLHLDAIRTLKMLHPAIARDEIARERLVREARVQARLTHPNILSLLALEITDEHTFIVLEYVEAVTLQQFLEDSRPEPKQILKLILQIASALSVAHGSGVIHRDIKPANILVDRRGVPLVTDFGLARAIDASSSMSGQTAGTVGYMPPEAFRGGSIDASADVWALGVMTQECLTGEHPFPGTQFEQIAYSVLNEEPPPIPDRIEQRLPGIRDFLAKALHKNPQERLHDGRAALEMLMAIADRAGFDPTWLASRDLGKVKARPSTVRKWLTAALATAAIALFFLLDPFHPDLTAEGARWPAMSDEGSPAWMPGGERLAFVASSGTQLLIRNLMAPDQDPVQLYTSEQQGINDVAWAADGTQLAILDTGELKLISPSDGSVVYAHPGEFSSISWDPAESRLLVSPGSTSPPHLVILELRSGASDGPIALEAERVPIQPADALPDECILDQAVFINQGERIVFRAADPGGGKILGLFVIPRKGGVPDRVVEGSFCPNHPVWDEGSEVLLFNRKGQYDIHFVHVPSSGTTTYSPRSLGIRDIPVSFDFDPQSRRLIYITSSHRFGLWTGTPLDGTITFSPINRDFETVYTPAFDTARNELLFAVYSCVGGTRIQRLRLSEVHGSPLHEDYPDLANEWCPVPDPISDRFVLFTANHMHRWGMYSYDRVWKRVSLLEPDPPDGGQIHLPSWSRDGAYITYSVHYPMGDRPSTLIRARLRRDPEGMTIVQRDTLVTMKGLAYALLSPDGDRLLLQCGESQEARLRILDSETGHIQNLAEGSHAALSADGRDLYWVRGTEILRLRDWAEWMEYEEDREVMGQLPQQATGTGYYRSLALSEDALYLVLQERDVGEVVWCTLVRDLAP